MRPFKLSPCATLVYELANTKKMFRNLSACATLVHELANAKKYPLNLSTCVTLVHEHANTKITDTGCMALFYHVAASGRPCMAPFMVLMCSNDVSTSYLIYEIDIFLFVASNISNNISIRCIY